MSDRQKALDYLYHELKCAKVALGRAERKQNVTAEEITNLENKIAAIDWLIPLAIKEEDTP